MTTFATRPIPVTVPVTERGRAIDGRSARHFPGLDGLRAIAVVLVMLFHLLPGSVVGGYVGVDLFFVISGFLITGLLVRERRSVGRLQLRSFWVRRARRLLPALAVVLLVTSSVALVLGGDVLVGLGRQLLGATTFSYNWLDIAGGTQYFNDTTPELFRNLLSLAVEEQFYLLWPLVVVGLLVVRRARTRVGVAVALGALSLGAMVTLFAIGASPTRVYYGTDTHSFGLAIGSALALAVDARPPSTWRPALRRTLPVAGLLSIAGIVVIALTLTEDGALVYRGGLALVAILTAIAIAACIAPGSLLGRALELEPVRWVGQRSFGLYLWHWPLYVLLGVALPQFTTDRDGLQLLGGAAACLTAVAATLSYRFAETPIRSVGFRAAIRAWGTRARAGRAGAWRAVATSTLALAVVTMTGLAVIVAPGEGSLQKSIEAGEKMVHQAPSVGPTKAPGQAAPAPTVLATMPTGEKITAIGDSVMLGVAPSLQNAYPGIDIHAKVSRQFSSAPDLVKKIADAGRLRPVLVVGLGTNGPVKQHDLDRILAVAGPDTELVLVNSQAPRDWTNGVNRQLASFTASHHRVWLADWHTAIHDHLDLLYDDKIHAKSAEGGRLYAATVTDAFARMIAPPASIDVNLFRTPAP
ncbi:acyltransferase family protein [soil metagenome]